MRSLLLLLLISSSSFAQIHQNSPIPEILEESKRVIDEELIGWSKSLDGQWFSSEMTIPIRAISQDEEAYETNESELGLDNISQLLLYKINYGEELLYALIKISNSGQYRYSTTQQKWQESEIAYYYIFDKVEMKRITDAEDNTSLVKIPLRDYGALGEVRSKKILASLKKNIIIKDKTDRLLVIALKTDSENADKIYFQFSSQHKIFPDVEGVLHDFKLQGNTVYSSPLLLDYLHYEYDKGAFNKFFSAE